MNHIGIELGIDKKPSREEDWTYADGRRLANTRLDNCLKLCAFRHPFNATKKRSCENVCKATHAEKIRQIELLEKAKEASNAVLDTQTGTHNTSSTLPPPPQKETTETNTNDKITVSEEKEGLSMAAKIAIGVGALALIVGAVVYFKRSRG